VTDSIPTDDTGVPHLIEVWAPWCASCRAMDAYRGDVADRFEGAVRFERVNAAIEPEAVEQLRVRGTPTFVGYVDGIEVYRAAGRLSQASLEDLFAGLAAGGTPSRRANHTDAVLRVGAGAALAVAGLALGPAWALVGVGALVAGTAVPIPRRSRASRP
jgi:thiol-disulfide isomerase/thioredoxin